MNYYDENDDATFDSCSDEDAAPRPPKSHLALGEAEELVDDVVGGGRAVDEEEVVVREARLAGHNNAVV